MMRKGFRKVCSVWILVSFQLTLIGLYFISLFAYNQTIKYDHKRELSFEDFFVTDYIDAHRKNLQIEYKLPQRNNSQLPRLINQTEYAILMNLLRDVSEILSEQNISFVLTYGTLVGSYMMHDQLPWDDDVDIFAHNNSKDAILDYFRTCKPRGICGYDHFDSEGMSVKLYYANSSYAGQYIWNWPFIDVLFYEIEETTVKAIDRVSKLSIPIVSFFPFHYRPFGPLWLPVPNEPWVLLSLKYNYFRCKSGTWNHREEKRKKSQIERCIQLISDYPFVKRSKSKSGTIESLVLDGKIIYSVFINEKYRPQKNLFTF